MSIRNLDGMMAPRSVALIGASARPGTLGSIVMERLTGSGFRGDIGFVNPRYQSIAGRPCVARVAELPFVPDLAVIATPAATVPALVGELGEIGTRAAVVISAGFTPDLQQAMLAAARPTCLRVLGPNCLGLQVPHMGLDATFAHLTAAPGHLALLSQSGAIVTAMLDWAAARGIGFSVVASMGDMADADVGDLLDYLAGDRRTRAVLMYLEGVTAAKKFMSAARSASRSKPVIAIKAGRTPSASRAAASHTGALAGSDDVYEAALARAGILRVDDLQALFDTAEALARHLPLVGDRLAILTNGGGAGVLAVDSLAGTHGRLAELSDETIARLDKVLPPAWPRSNPVDIIGDAGPGRYAAALEALLDAPEADAILVLNCPTGLASSAEAAEAVVSKIARRRSASPKPVLASWLGGTSAANGGQILERAGIAFHATPGQAIGAFSDLVRFRKAKLQLLQAPPSAPEGGEADRVRAEAIIEAALGEGRTMLSEPEAKAILSAYRIPTVETRIAATPEAAGAAAAEMAAHGPSAPLFVVKILSHDIVHKSDVGGVRLNLAGAAEVEAAARSMMARVRALKPQARIEGVVVEPMIHRPDAHELIIGLGDDPTFGPVVIFGAGGTSVEVVADKALALPPLDLLLAGEMIDGTRIARLMKGYRDTPAADIPAVAAALVRLSQLAADLPQVRELDVNPLLADAGGVIALDARVRIAAAERVPAGGNPRFAIRPYPAAWDKPGRTRDGPIRIRPIRPQDEALYPDFLAKMTAEDMKRRFFGAVSEIGRERIARFTQIDYARAMAFVALSSSGELVGVSRLVTDPDGQSAEFAVLVRSDRVGRGVGRALMERLVAYARAEGVAELSGDILGENVRMLSFARKLGFSITVSPDDPQLRHARLDLTTLPAPAARPPA